MKPNGVKGEGTMYQLKMEDCPALVDRMAGFLVAYCMKCNIQWLVLGCSGGRDSFVTMGVIARAREIARERNFRLFAAGAVLPIHSSEESVELGLETIRMFDAKPLYITDLEPIYDEMADGKIIDLSGTNCHTVDQQLLLLLAENTPAQLSNRDWNEKIARGNLKARLRMIKLFDIARRLDGIVMSTDNLSELWMGFWTLHGDVGNIGLIQQVLKGLEIETLVEYFRASQRLLATKPDDGLGIGNGDEDQLGAPYPILDRVMIELIQLGFDPDGGMSQLGSLPAVSAAPPEVVQKLAKRSLSTAFKRREGGCLAPTRAQLGLPPIMEINLYA